MRRELNFSIGRTVSTVLWRECCYCHRPYTTRGKRRCGCTHVPTSGVKTLACRDCGVPFDHVIVSNHPTRCERCRRIKKRETKRARGKLYGKTYRSRARAYGVRYEPVNRMKVFARDKWRCQLCGKPVDRDAKAPHPLSVTLDHVVPMSVGGDHTYANVQCAHFLCNSIKGNRGSQQLALVG